MKIPLSRIKIGDRQRNFDPNHAQEIADSYSQIGQVTAITVAWLKEPEGDYDYILIAGRHRYGAAELLKWPEIECTIYGETDEVKRQQAQYEEDFRRKDRTWQENLIAMYNLHNLITIQRNAVGEKWNIRCMADYAKISKSKVGYMMAIAKELLANPNGEMWQMANQFDAMKFLINRNVALLDAELNRRRLATVVSKNPPPPPFIVSPTFVEGGNKGFIEQIQAPSQLLSAVQTLDKTPFLPLPVEDEPVMEIKLQGWNMELKARVYDSIYKLAIVPKPPLNGEFVKHIYNNLDPQHGVAIFWIPAYAMMEQYAKLCLDAGFYVMPWPLIWNKSIAFPKVALPFSPNYNVGLVCIVNIAGMSTQTYTSPSSSTITCQPDESGELPSAVVEFSLRQFTNDNDQVLLPINAPVLAVAECGRIPVFCEPDPEKFKNKQDQLEEFYLMNFANCKVVR